MHRQFSRRDLLRMCTVGLGALAFRPPRRERPLAAGLLPAVPPGTLLGRVIDPLDLRTEPNTLAPALTTLYEDTLIEWKREVIGAAQGLISQRWIETSDGYLYAPAVQPVRNEPNTPLASLPAGQVGFWAEVTVPFVDLVLQSAPISPWIKSLQQYGFPPRLYFGQVVWIDQVRTDNNGVPVYRWNEDFGHGYGYGDIFWAEGAALRPLAPGDIAPLSPDIDPASKRIVVDVNYQTLSCFESSREVFFCRVSTGAKWDAAGNLVDNWATPVGDLNTHWKIISLNMSAGTTAAGYSTPAVPWCTFIHGDGVAIHGAFWHNDFGTPRSHGCINCRPQDAKWIFRWTTPPITLEQPEQRLTWPDHGTVVSVTERVV